MDKNEIYKLRSAISDIMALLANRMMSCDAQAEEISSHFRYTEEDLWNALVIFNHVWSSYAIHSGAFNMDNAYEKMSQFKRQIEATFGVNTFELTDKVCNKKDYGTDTEKNSSEE